jgi:hypothetical protein
MSDSPDRDLNIDELLEQMALDELSDAPLMSPVDYAKVRPISPQLVYYRIRTGKLRVVLCNCGRKCIDRKEADDFFRELRGEVAWPYGKENE